MFKNRKDIMEIDPKVIQSRCPCVRCEKQLNLQSSAQLRILSAKKIGNYGYSFVFSSGCSSGIYPLSLLRSIE